MIWLERLKACWKDQTPCLTPLAEKISVEFLSATQTYLQAFSKYFWGLSPHCRLKKIDTETFNEFSIQTESLLDLRHQWHKSTKVPAICILSMNYQPVPYDASYSTPCHAQFCSWLGSYCILTWWFFHFNLYISSELIADVFADDGRPARINVCGSPILTTDCLE